MKRIILALIMGLSPPALWAQGDPITGFAGDDAKMNAAMAEAQLTLPRFLAHATDAEGYSHAGASIKVAFDVAGGGVEVIWIEPFLSGSTGAFIGLLANEPNYLSELHAGDRVEFSAGMVRDWSWYDGQALWGNYTTRVMLPYLSAQEAGQLTAVLSPEPTPEDW